MRIANAILAVGLALVLVVVLLLIRQPSLPAGDPPTPNLVLAEAPSPILPEGQNPERTRSVYDISLHDAGELRVLLERLDQVSQQPLPQGHAPEIALVLHGPELELFAIRNYGANKALVDLAAKLDAFQAIEVKACNTRMQMLGLEPRDMPAFIEIVPFGPDEVERLVGEGYLKM